MTAARNRRRMRRARDVFFGTRSRLRGFVAAAGALRIPPAYRGLRWVSAVILLLLAIQLATGILLALYYYPEPGTAYDSTRFLMSRVSAGWLMRSVHHWAGELLLVAACVHLATIWFRRAYTRPREYEWVTGGCLLLALLAFRFTGRLLPWDTIGYGAAQEGLALIGTVPLVGSLLSGWLRGGEEMGPNTLSRFFATHVLILPWVVLALGWLHLFLVRRHGLKEDSR